MSNAILPYDLRLEERHGYLYALIAADSIDRPTALDYLKKLADRVHSSHAERLLLDRDIPAMMSDGDIFFTTQDLLKMIPNIRVAFVNTYATIHAQMEFAMMIGTNRGANYKLFNNVPEAEEWLTAGIGAKGDD